MKILIIGLLTFFIWSAFSTYIYVCEIRGLCNDPVATEVGMSNQEISRPVENDVEVQETKVVPENKVVYFAFDKSDFKPNAGLERYFDELDAYLKQNLLVKLNITGHTDAIGTDDYNLALGYRRAQSVKRYFENKGIPNKKINIESKGESQPVDTNSSQEGRANNRRTVITIKN